jgi:hypothetical protein
MRRASLLAFWPAIVAAAATAAAAPRVDNVLVRMVPPGVTSLVGAHMDQLLASDLYQKLAAQQKLPQLDQFARETGFDPRRDVREVLLATTGQGSVLLARGAFSLKQGTPPGMKLVRHGQYNIFADTSGTSGFCILDSTLASAGELPVLESALDEWSGGSHKAAQPLLNTVATLNEQTSLWGASTGFAGFLSENLPRAGNGIDFSAVFRGIESTWFSVSVASGFQAAIHGTTATEQDAIALRDTAKGLIGLGRLSVPDGQPDLLRFWDGITVEQAGRSFTLNADIADDLIGQMVRLLSAPGGRAGRGGTGRGRRGGRGGSGPGAP